VHLLTEAKFAAIFAGSPWIERLWIREDLVSEAAVQDLGHFDRVIDLQATASAHAIARKLGPCRRVRTRSLARRWVVLTGGRWLASNIPHSIERYAEAAGLSDVLSEKNALPKVFVTDEERSQCQEQYPSLVDPPSRPRVALLTGASRRSKEYPRASFLEVGKQLLDTGAEVLWVEGPDQVDGETTGQVIRTSLGTLKAVLSRIDLAITGDSGPMHLATALGRPTLALFGSSVRALGFWPLGKQSRVLEVDGLSCRPCGVHGRNHCRRGDWACLEGLTPDRVVAEAQALLQESRRGGGGQPPPTEVPG
jgi:ADP-heptose:LPS heptosyltransferase